MTYVQLLQLVQNKRAIPLRTLLVVRAAQNISELLPTPARNDRIRVLSHRDTSKYPIWLELILKNKHDCHTGLGHENDRKLIIANPPELLRGKMAGFGFWPDTVILNLFQDLSALIATASVHSPKRAHIIDRTQPHLGPEPECAQSHQHFS